MELPVKRQLQRWLPVEGLDKRVRDRGQQSESDECSKEKEARG